MSYIRQCREFPNKCYQEVERDEVKYLFDTLTDNSDANIIRITGFKKHFVQSTLSNYTTKKYRA